MANTKSWALLIVFVFALWSFSIIFTSLTRNEGTLMLPWESLEDIEKRLARQPRPRADISAGPNAKTWWDRIPITLHMDPSKVVRLKAEDPTDPGEKVFVDPSLLTEGKRAATLFTIGVANDVSFERHMVATHQCKAYALDCTSPATMADEAAEASVTFRPWCIGKESQLGAFYLSQRTEGAGKPVFKSLAEAVKQLDVGTIDILKMDIEGYEWSVLEREVLDAGVLPRQLLFELHLEGANPMAVPFRVVKGRQERQLVKLFERLFEAVISLFLFLFFFSFFFFFLFLISP